MIIQTNGDIFKDIEPWSIIMHQTNCMGVAGGGVALQMRQMFPGWYLDYKALCDQESNKSDLLGHIHTYKVRDDFLICSAFAQTDISKTMQMTDYQAWDKILRHVEKEITLKNRRENLHWKLVVPYGIGCGLGGGDWNIMRDMFDFYFKNSSVTLIIKKRD